MTLCGSKRWLGLRDKLAEVLIRDLFRRKRTDYFSLKEKMPLDSHLRDFSDVTRAFSLVSYASLELT